MADHWRTPHTDSTIGRDAMFFTIGIWLGFILGFGVGIVVS